VNAELDVVPRPEQFHTRRIDLSRTVNWNVSGREEQKGICHGAERLKDTCRHGAGAPIAGNHAGLLVGADGFRCKAENSRDLVAFVFGNGLQDGPFQW